MQKLVNQIEKELNIKVNTIVLLEEGITNSNYLINDEVVYKIKNPLISAFNSTVNEKQITRNLVKLGITPPHKFYGNNVLIPYVKGAIPVSSLKKEQYFQLLINHINQIHKTKINKSTKDFSIYKRIDYYKKVVGDLKIINEKRIIQLSKIYYEKANKVMCHNDLVAGNILFVNEKLYLIDFEYAGLNDPDFDVVSFISENPYLSIDDINIFLQMYYVEIPHDKIAAYVDLANVLWAYWAMFCYKQTKKAIFLEIANYKLNKLSS